MSTTSSNEQIFERAVEFVLNIEGGESNDEDDPGGLTNFGISSRYHPDVDVENLTAKEAIEIYRRDYWEKFRCPELAPMWAVALFDGVVNQNQEAVVQMLQNAVGATVDGIMGPETISRANQRRDAFALGMFFSERVNRYMTVSKEKFRQGLVRRALESYAFARNQM